MYSTLCIYREDEYGFNISYTCLEACKAKEKVKERKKELWDLIKKKGFEYTPITHFYHVTRSHLKDTILQERRLKRSKINLYKESVDSPAHQTLKGVFFTCNLRDGRYPSISPFGTERVKIPIEDFFKKYNYQWYQLYFNSFNFTSTTNCCIELVMVSRKAPEYKFCRDHMVSLDFVSNDFLRLDFFNSEFSCCQMTSIIQLWLELIVVGDVPITDEYEWDTVDKFGTF